MSVYEEAKRKRLNAPEWKKTLVKELLKPKLKRFKRRHVSSLGVDRIWTADLADMQKYARQNKGFKYILVVCIQPLFLESTFEGQDWGECHKSLQRHL